MSILKSNNEKKIFMRTIIIYVPEKMLKVLYVFVIINVPNMLSHNQSESIENVLNLSVLSLTFFAYK